MLFLCKSDFAELILSAPFCYFDSGFLKNILCVAMVELSRSVCCYDTPLHGNKRAKSISVML